VEQEGGHYDADGEQGIQSVQAFQSVQKASQREYGRGYSREHDDNAFGDQTSGERIPGRNKNEYGKDQFGDLIGVVIDAGEIPDIVEVTDSRPYQQQSHQQQCGYREIRGSVAVFH
jgi:hypothetical protein